MGGCRPYGHTEMVPWPRSFGGQPPLVGTLLTLSHLPASEEARASRSSVSNRPRPMMTRMSLRLAGGPPCQVVRQVSPPCTPVTLQVTGPCRPLWGFFKHPGPYPNPTRWDNRDNRTVAPTSLPLPPRITPPNAHPRRASTSSNPSHTPAQLQIPTPWHTVVNVP